MDASWTMLDEYEKLVRRMNRPRVVIDNESCNNATVVRVDSANRYGILLEVVQILADLNLIITKAYISSDGGWFMDVFNVTDSEGKKVRDGKILDCISESLGEDPSCTHTVGRLIGIQPSNEHTSIELTGTDRPGLLSEVCAVLSYLKCNVVNVELWTHNTRAAAVMHVTDEATGLPINDPQRLSRIKELLCNVLRGNNRSRGASATVSFAHTHTERRLHQMMFADRDYERGVQGCMFDTLSPQVTVKDCTEKDYSVVTIRCKDRPKLLFDTVCTLTDMQYVVFHANVYAETPEAYQVIVAYGQRVPEKCSNSRTVPCVSEYEKRSSRGFCHLQNKPQRSFSPNGTKCLMTCQTESFSLCVFFFFFSLKEYYIRHLDGCPVNSEAEKQRLIQCLQAAIERRVSQGLKLELCTTDRVGLLSDVTRLFRENSLSVTRAEVTTRGGKAINTFYVCGASGHPVDEKTIDHIRSEIGQTILKVKHNSSDLDSAPQESSTKFLFSNLFRSRSFYNFGLVRLQ